MSGTKRDYLTPVSTELGFGLEMKAVEFSLSFPMHGRRPQTDKRSSSYSRCNERCKITIYSENK
jgi:hypothetical protein